MKRSILLTLICVILIIAVFFGLKQYRTSEPEPAVIGQQPVIEKASDSIDSADAPSQPLKSPLPDTSDLISHEINFVMRGCGVVDLLFLNDNWFCLCQMKMPRQYGYGKLIKLDTRGVILWERDFIKSDLEVARLIPVAHDRLMVAGTDSPTYDDRAQAAGDRFPDVENSRTGETLRVDHKVNSRAWLATIDLSGNLISEHYFGDEGDYFLSSVTAIDAGHFILSGSRLSPQSVSLFLIKIDSAAELSEEKSIPLTRQSLSEDLAVSDNSGYWVGITEDSIVTDKMRMGLLYIDAAGNVIFRQRFDDGQPEETVGVTPLHDGRAIIYGRHVSSGDESSGVIRLIDNSGTVVWNRSLSSAPLKVLDINGELMIATAAGLIQFYDYAGSPVSKKGLESGFGPLTVMSRINDRQVVLAGMAPTHETSSDDHALRLMLFETGQ